MAAIRTIVKRRKQLKQSEMKVEYVSTDSLVPYANNAKIHTETQLGQIETSILEFGFNDPIAVWENSEGSLEIVEGHGRVLAAKRLGMEKVPIVRLDHMTDEQRRAYTHIHNQLTMSTGWDFSTLESDIGNLDFNFEEFGFNTIMNRFVEFEKNQDVEAEEIPDDFNEYDESIETQNKCPMCGYEF